MVFVCVRQAPFQTFVFHLLFPIGCDPLWQELVQPDLGETEIAVAGQAIHVGRHVNTKLRRTRQDLLQCLQVIQHHRLKCKQRKSNAFLHEGKGTILGHEGNEVALFHKVT